LSVTEWRMRQDKDLRTESVISNCRSVIEKPDLDHRETASWRSKPYLADLGYHSSLSHIMDIYIVLINVINILNM